MSDKPPVDTEKLTITDPRMETRSLIRMTGVNNAGVIQFLDSGGNVTAQLDEGKLRAIITLVNTADSKFIRLNSSINSAQTRIDQLATRIDELATQVAALNRFNTRNFVDEGAHLKINKRVVPMDGLQAADDNGVSIHDNNTPGEGGGRMILMNYGADSSIRSRDNNRFGEFFINK